MSNQYFDIIADNRRTVYQLDADDMGATTWKQYRTLCDNLAKAAWNSLRKKENEENLVGMSLAGLFAFFELDLKAMPEFQNRILLACIDYKRIRSDEMKDARKALSDAKKALAKAIEDKVEDTTALKNAVENAESKVDDLKAIPGNEYFDPTPMLDSTKKHASTKCRKYIEDAICDFATEQELKSAEQLAEEALALKMLRKAHKKMKAEQEKAEVRRAVMDELQERGIEVDG